MPNYQTGTLLASSGDVLTQLMTVLDTYLTARGWTVNLFADYRQKYEGDNYVGKRIHAEKSINGIDRFINIRSMKVQRIFDNTTNDIVTGLGVIGSTAYDGATHVVTLTSVQDLGGGTIRFNGAELFAAVGDTVTVAGTTDYNGGHTVIATDEAGGGLVDVTASFNGSQSGTITGPSRWDNMTGRPQYSSGNARPQGGGALGLPADVLNYFLFSENSGDNIYLVCNNSTGYTGICFGVTTTGNYFVAGARTEESDDLWRNKLLAKGESTDEGIFALRKLDNTDWYDWPAQGSTGIANLPELQDTNTTQTQTYSLVSQLLFCSPDNFKGNNPLIPAYMGIGNIVLISSGVIPGIKYVNMKFMDSLTELTFGGDVYKLFRLYTADDANDATVGLALLK